MGLFGFTGTDSYLSLDRTNWKWGGININLLVLAVVYRGAAIPAYWLPPDKRGNSGGRERMALLQRFIGRFGKSRINRPLAGRGFVGDQWMAWLTKQQIPFFIRIRNNSISANSRGQKTRVEQLFYTLKPGEIKCLPHSRPLGQCTVCLNALRLADGGLLLVASNRLAQDAVTIYGLRWEIETLLGCLKGRGFKLEETRVLDHLRIKKLLVLPWPHLAGPLRPAIGNTVVCCPSRPKHTGAGHKAFLGTGWIVSVPDCLMSFQGRLSDLENCFHCAGPNSTSGTSCRGFANSQLIFVMCRA